jgi:hypothetical protein
MNDCTLVGYSWLRFITCDSLSNNVNESCCEPYIYIYIYIYIYREREREREIRLRFLFKEMAREEDKNV